MRSSADQCIEYADYPTVSFQNCNNLHLSISKKMENYPFDSTVEMSKESTESDKSNSPTKNGLELKRNVGLVSGVALVVGNMIGSGIFISPGGVLERSGSVGLSMVLWAACGLIAIFGSLSYAELGTLIPKSGGEYSYYINCFGPFHPFWGPLPGFLYSWLAVLLLRPASFAVGCLSCAVYTVYPILQSLDICLSTETEDLLVKLIAIVYIGLVTAINCYDVNWLVRAQNTFTIAKLLGLGTLIGCGVYQLSVGNTQYLAEGFKGSNGFGTIGTAFYGGLWAFDGWNNLNCITEELKNPSVNLPRGIMIGIPLVTFIYLSANIAYFAVLSPQTIIQSNAVAVDVGNYMLGPYFRFLMPLSVAFSTFGSVLATAFVNGRLCFATAREGHMIDVLSYVHVDSRIPSPAIIFSSVVACGLVGSKTLTNLIDFFTFSILIFYILAMIVLLVLRKTRPDAPRPFRVPLFIPVCFIVVCSYLVVAPIVSEPMVEYLYVLVVLVIGFVVYIPFVYYKFSFNCLGWITKIVQLTLKVGPTLKLD